jgi:hypothetical protein
MQKEMNDTTKNTIKKKDDELKKENSKKRIITRKIKSVKIIREPKKKCIKDNKELIEMIECVSKNIDKSFTKFENLIYYKKF